MLATSLNSYSAVRYISDDIYVFLLAGPGTQYRITGTVKVGEKINTLKLDNKTKFMKVKTKAGKVGWVKSSELQQGLPAKTRLPVLQKQLKNTQKRLRTIDQDNKKDQSDNITQLSTQETLIKNLRNDKVSLQETITSLEARNLELDLLQDTKEDRIQMEWMINGGAVLFFGLILGLILPLMPRRKKNKNKW